MRLDVYIHEADNVKHELIIARLDSLIRNGAQMSAELDRLTTEVAETKTAIDSALTLIAGLADQIRQLKDEPAKLAALADELDAKQADIAAAVTANTTP